MNFKRLPVFYAPTINCTSGRDRKICLSSVRCAYMIGDERCLTASPFTQQHRFRFIILALLPIDSAPSSQASLARQCFCGTEVKDNRLDLFITEFMDHGKTHFDFYLCLQVIQHLRQRQSLQCQSLCHFQILSMIVPSDYDTARH